MEYDEFLREVLPSLGYAWRPHRRRAVRRKIVHRMDKLHIHTFEDYLPVLQASGQEIELFKQFLPVTVSRFFRNHEYFEFLRDSIFPDLLRRSSRTLQIWSIGAAAGEEAYSIAIVWDDCFASKHPEYNIRIRASDIDGNIMERGKTGIYEKSSLKELPKELVQRYFQVVDNRYLLDPSIKGKVEWLRHDIREGPPLLENDILFCCYCAFHYFSNEIQNELIARLANSLVPEGYLVLGRKDVFPKIGLTYFQPVSSRLKVFKRLS